MTNLISFFKDLQLLLAGHPGLLFLAIAVLPGCGFPVSILFTLAGVVWGSSVQSCVIVIAALAINLTWTYWLARSSVGEIIRSRIPSKWLRFFESESGGSIQAILVLRLTPGMPIFVQNYVLGLLKVPFLTYLPLSLFLSSLWACAFVVSGGAIFHGDIGYAIAGVSLFIVAILVRKMFKRYSPPPSVDS